MFKDRRDAGRKLAQTLQAYRGTGAVVLALPRGGVALGYEVAHALSLPLDIIAVRKIGHPASPEHAIGAVDENGVTILNESETNIVSKSWLKEETARQQKEAHRRSTAYRAGKTPAAIAGKTAIIVDDGIATGFTMRLAVRSVKLQKAAKIIVAVPVAPPESLQILRKEGADEIFVLEPPEEFAGAVGAHYIAFDQVEDDEVVRLLENASRLRKTNSPGH
ncbi:MAG TPA: phosphoribosyltransferase family protein [Candidatus Paceibacterota bacterium]